MPTRPLSDRQLRQTAEAYKRLGSDGYKLISGVSQKAYDTRVSNAVAKGFVSRADRRTVAADTPMPDDKTPEAPPPPRSLDIDGLRTVLTKAPASLAELVDRLQQSRGTIIDAIDTLKVQGVNVQEHGDRFSIMHVPAPKHQMGSKELPEYSSRPDGTYVFGFTSDNHLCSKYSRLDVLNDLYDRFAEQRVDRVFNAGNWIDGEARFNVHDLLVHGMDAQVRYLAANYPQRPGITTYAVAGDDHEGWYCASSGVDIGRYAERVMRDAGRTDWVDLGYMEAYIRLVHAKSGASTMLHNIHPGGGSAYALSYTTQKIAESYDGGDKPAVALVGHYHKLCYHMSRNVHMIQTGTTEDQTPFMRKKKLAAHVGGGICKLRQDAKTGAITACSVEFFNYFVRDYYNDRWSHSGDVTLADRMPA